MTAFIRNIEYCAGLLGRFYEREKLLLKRVSFLLLAIIVVSSGGLFEQFDVRSSRVAIAAAARPLVLSESPTIGPVAAQAKTVLPISAQPVGPGELTDNTQNLSPLLLERFKAFRQFIFDNYGVVLGIRSGWRSYEEQADLYRTKPAGWANPPGRSKHEIGEAIDYSGYGTVYNQHLGTFGLAATVAHEQWHIERVEPH